MSDRVEFLIKKMNKLLPDTLGRTSCLDKETFFKVLFNIKFSLDFISTQNLKYIKGSVLIKKTGKPNSHFGFGRGRTFQKVKCPTLVEYPFCLINI